MHLPLEKLDLRNLYFISFRWLFRLLEHFRTDVHGDEVFHISQAMEVPSGAASQIQDRARAGKFLAERLQPATKAPVISRFQVKLIAFPVFPC